MRLQVQVIDTGEETGIQYTLVYTLHGHYTVTRYIFCIQVYCILNPSLNMIFPGVTEGGTAVCPREGDDDELYQPPFTNMPGN